MNCTLQVMIFKAISNHAWHFGVQEIDGLASEVMFNQKELKGEQRFKLNKKPMMIGLCPQWPDGWLNAMARLSRMLLKLFVPGPSRPSFTSPPTPAMSMSHSCIYWNLTGWAAARQKNILENTFHDIYFFQTMFENCPDKCHCSLNNINTPLWVSVNCSSLNLTKLPEKLPENTLELDISHNQVSFIKTEANSRNITQPFPDNKPWAFTKVQVCIQPFKEITCGLQWIAQYVRSHRKSFYEEQANYS